MRAAVAARWAAAATFFAAGSEALSAVLPTEAPATLTPGEQQLVRQLARGFRSDLATARADLARARRAAAAAAAATRPPPTPASDRHLAAEELGFLQLDGADPAAPGGIAQDFLILRNARSECRGATVANAFSSREIPRSAAQAQLRCKDDPACAFLVFRPSLLVHESPRLPPESLAVAAGAPRKFPPETAGVLWLCERSPVPGWVGSRLARDWLTAVDVTRVAPAGWGLLANRRSEKCAADPLLRREGPLTPAAAATLCAETAGCNFFAADYAGSHADAAADAAAGGGGGVWQQRTFFCAAPAPDSLGPLRSAEGSLIGYPLRDPSEPTPPRARATASVEIGPPVPVATPGDPRTAPPPEKSPVNGPIALDDLHHTGAKKGDVVDAFPWEP